jgi:hypothetical protein
MKMSKRTVYRAPPTHPHRGVRRTGIASLVVVLFLLILVLYLGQSVREEDFTRQPNATEYAALGVPLVCIVPGALFGFIILSHASLLGE